MATVILRPAGAGHSNGLVGTYDMIDEVPPDDGDFVVVGGGTPWPFGIFTVTAHGLPDGASIDNVTFNFRGKRNTPVATGWGLYLRLGATYHTGTTRTNVSEFQAFTESYGTHPITGVAWTRDDLTGLEMGLWGTSSSGLLTHGNSLSWIEAVVTYTAGPAATAASREPMTTQPLMRI